MRAEGEEVCFVCIIHTCVTECTLSSNKLCSEGFVLDHLLHGLVYAWDKCSTKYLHSNCIGMKHQVIAQVIGKSNQLCTYFKTFHYSCMTIVLCHLQGSPLVETNNHSNKYFRLKMELA